MPVPRLVGGNPTYGTLCSCLGLQSPHVAVCLGMFLRTPSQLDDAVRLCLAACRRAELQALPGLLHQLLLLAGRGHKARILRVGPTGRGEGHCAHPASPLALVRFAAALQSPTWSATPAFSTDVTCTAQTDALTLAGRRGAVRRPHRLSLTPIMASV